MKEGLSYDDVLLKPRRSSLISRKDVELRTKLTKTLWINNPIIAANMDTVCGSKMAIAIAKLGGIGIIHRFNTIEEQVEEVKKVKRFRNQIIQNPLTISPDISLKEAMVILEKNEISSAVVTDEQQKVVGILTQRDIRFKPSKETMVRDLMTPKGRLITAYPGIEQEEARKLLMENKVEKLPIVNENDHLVGLITSKDLHKKTKYPYDTLDANNRLMCGAAIGVKGDSIERAEALIKIGVDVLVIDIAHGHSDLVINTLSELKSKWPEMPIIAGNVCTPEGTFDLINAGADAIKVGVGPGANCSTRIVTGCGYPQLSAIIECFEVARKYEVPIIADGGIKTSGDITKAVCAGADTIMIGSIISGTDESPGQAIVKDGQRFKIYRGMASSAAKNSKDTKDNKKIDNDYVAEGVEALVPYKGSVKDILTQLLGGLRSGMSYCGVKTVRELIGLQNFVQITSAGMHESVPHNKNRV